MKPSKQTNPKSTFLWYFPWDLLKDFIFIIMFILILLLSYFEINRIDSNINIVYEMAKGKQYSEEIDLVAVVNRTQEIAKGWFNYNMTNKQVGVMNMTLWKIHNEGTICSQFSNYFSYVFKDLGFNTKEISMPEMNHRVLMVWSNDSYCLIDQTNFWCQN